MRFAITAVDRCLSVFDTLLAEGWEAVKLFTIPSTPTVNLNRAVIERAVGLGLPVQLSRMVERDLADLADRGCEVLICASYDWKIGDWRPYMPYALNFHPSPLPQARGPYPAFQALLEGRRDWGVTCHKLEPTFDTGDILADEAFDLSEGECHESLSLKTQMAFARLTGRVARDIDGIARQTNLLALNASIEAAHSACQRSTDCREASDRTAVSIAGLMCDATE